MSDLVASLAALAAFVLLGGAFYLWRVRKAGRQALLMVVLAAVLLTNLVIWTAPVLQPAATGAHANPGVAGSAR